MMGVLRLLVLVYQLYTIRCVVCDILPLWFPIDCSVQCSILLDGGSIIGCQVCPGWPKSCWSSISGHTSWEQFTECMQWHDITTCTGVDLASQCCLLVVSNLSRHLNSCKCFCHSVQYVYLISVYIQDLPYIQSIILTGGILRHS